MNVRYRITLTSEEREQLRSFVQAGKGAFRRLERAQILLAAAGGSTDADIAANVVVGTSTVYRTKRRFVEEGLAPKPGRPARFDYEYVRNGTANVFMFVDARRPWRHAKVTDRRTCRDFAECMRDLVDIHYPKAEPIRVVMDNLSTHTPSALYESFEPAEARRILRRLEIHYTPKHASWLNMVEIEIGVMVLQCLDRRIPTKTRGTRG
jgi:transposase